MPRSKFRLFAGPNASGKTHVFQKFRSAGYIHTEIYVNADKIQAELERKRKFSFNAYRVKVGESEFKQYILHSGLFESKIKDSSFLNTLTLRSGILRINKNLKINSYHASFIASYLAEKLFETGQDFAFETVMSHESKVDMINLARKNGYKTYFYFIFTDSPTTNLARVRLRVKVGGHNVPDCTILDRIPRTFALMPKAFKLADSSYVIDNSIDARLIVKKENNKLSFSPPYPENIEKQIEKIIGNKGKIT